MNNVLKGIRVIDMTTFLAAPTVSRVLGEWGADVIKVEAPNGDAGRTQGSVFNMHYSDDENLGFDVSNMNKRFMTLNLKKEEALNTFYDLLSSADVFLTNLRTKSLEHLGIDYEALKKKFPHLIFAQVLGYGPNGPNKNAAGFDATAYMARGGVLGTSLEKGSTPMNPPNGYGDFQVAMCLVAGICGALVKQQKDGKGDKVTVSLHHTSVFMQNIAMVSAQYGNEYPKTRKEVANPFNNSYKTSDDRWFVMCVPVYNRDFNKVMHVIGRDDLQNNEKYNDIDKVNDNNLNREFINILDEEFSKQKLNHWIEAFKEADLPLEACYVPTEIYKDHEALDNDVIRKVEFPSGNKRFIPTNPVRFESQGDPELKVSRAQGTDTKDILKELGYSEEKISKMIKDDAASSIKHLDE